MVSSLSHSTILLVEDNPDDEALTLRALEKNNLANEVVVARDGVEALEYLFAEGKYADRNPAAVPALVLLDIQLPKIDGFGVLKRLRATEHTRYLPVVMLTSSAQQEDILTSYGLGANSYIRKPVDFDEFMETVSQLGPYWLLLNQQPETV
ncbi:MAG TPA: response regulator [Gammaproteobacteria bacterium]|nr:response regulator [Gammaproteobacteria bacterium]